MMLRISNLDLAALTHLAREARPHEVCGLLVGLRRGRWNWVLRTVAAPNRSAQHPSFVVDPVTWRDVERGLQGSESIIGVFHSHPEGAARPSEADIRSLMRIWGPDSPWSVLILGARNAGSYRLRSGRIHEEPVILG